MIDNPAPGKIDEKLTSLRGEIETREREIHEDAQRIVRLLEEDFPAYLRREVKARFLAAPAFAEGTSSEAIARLKRDIETEGRQVSAEIAGSLRDAALWLVDTGEGEQVRELSDIPGVWQRIARIVVTLEGLLTKYDFPHADAGGHRAEYRPPTWFVQGGLLKTLLENYRAHVAERSRLRRAVEALELERRRAALDLKWESAD